jgi:hypothetical protein
MNTMNKSLFSVLLSLLMVFGTIQSSAQSTKGNKKIVKETRSVEAFTGIDVGGAFNVYFTQQENMSLVVEADENLLEKISTNVNGETLYIKSNNIKNATSLNIYLSAPGLNELIASGAANVKNENTLNGESLNIRVSGAASVELDIKINDLTTDASGAGYLKLSGSAAYHDVDASGAAEVKAGNLETIKTTANASGAADLTIRASEEAISETSGAGSVSILGNPEITTKNVAYTTYETSVGTNVRSWESGDTTTVNVGNVTVEVIEGDSTKVTVGSRTLIVDDYGNVKWRRNYKQKFNGHWAGFDLGVNGYVDKNWNINVPAEYEYLTLKYEKSIDVNINIYEQNINLARQKFGMLTGIGLRWNNYRFSNNVVLSGDSSEIYGYYDYSKDWAKSKLVVNYLTIPLLFEYQTNRYMRKNSFHVTAGVMFGWRYASHTKMLYFDDGRHKPKDSDNFHLNPFRYDAMFRIGWGVINLYANYSMNTLFKKDSGPELYPFAVGITLVGW